MIACGNAAGLLLRARTCNVSMSMPCAAALGASPLPILSSGPGGELLLASLAAAVGAGLSMRMCSGLESHRWRGHPRLDAVHLGWPWLVFCLTAAGWRACSPAHCRLGVRSGARPWPISRQAAGRQVWAGPSAGWLATVAALQIA